MSDTATGVRPGSATIQGDLWSARARDYAELMECQFRPLYESALRHAEIGGARACLDIGCGPGLAAQIFAQKFADVSGIDASPGFIAIARQRLPGRDLRLGEMESLSYADASFDVVTGFNSFQYAASPAHAVAEARRVLRPSGALVIATWGLPQDCDAAGHLKALGSLMPPPPPGASGPFALSDEAKLKALASDAGFVPVAVEEVACPWTFRDLETALRGMLSAGPAEQAIRCSSMERAREVVAESIAQYRNPADEYHLNNKFRYLVARG
jgi:ubiquinone/menaquinone biosynthesis C-methylase UbiE